MSSRAVAESVPCAGCGRRAGAQARWRAGAETALFCQACDADALLRAARWTPGLDTHIGVWRCWAVGCTWSMTWAGSWVEVCGELPRRVARDALCAHAEQFDDDQHRSIARDLRVQRQVTPSEIAEM